MWDQLVRSWIKEGYHFTSPWECQTGELEGKDCYGFLLLWALLLLCCYPTNWRWWGGKSQRRGVMHCAHQVCEILCKIQGKGGPDGKQYTEVFLGPLIGQKVGTRMLRGKIPAQHSPHISQCRINEFCTKSETKRERGAEHSRGIGIPTPNPTLLPTQLPNGKAAGYLVDHYSSPLSIWLHSFTAGGSSSARKPDGWGVSWSFMILTHSGIFFLSEISDVKEIRTISMRNKKLFQCWGEQCCFHTDFLIELTQQSSHKRWISAECKKQRNPWAFTTQHASPISGHTHHADRNILLPVA